MKAIYQSYLNYFGSLTPESVSQLDEIASESFHFVDPFNDVRSRSQATHIFLKMFKTVKDPKFHFINSHEESGTLYVLWDFTFRSRLLLGGPDHILRGMSVIQEHNGKIIEHIDYWDSGKHIYAKIPVLSLIIGMLRKVLG